MSGIKYPKNAYLKLFFEYGLHIWLIIFISNVIVLYAVHIFLRADTCMTVQQVRSDNRCLYIWGEQIYQEGTRENPYKGYPCGTDITSVLPEINNNDQTKHIHQNFVANVCKGSASVQADINALPSAPVSISPSISYQPGMPSSNTSLSSVPLESLLPSEVPTVTPTATPIGPVISIIFQIPGIGSGGANFKPLHPNRNLTIYLYAADANSNDKSVKPIYTVNTQATYDGNPDSPTYSSFIAPFIDLGKIDQIQYQVALKTDREQIVDEIESTKKVRVTHTDLLVAVLNASWSAEGIHLHDHVNMGVAIAVNDGARALDEVRTHADTGRAMPSMSEVSGASCLTW